MNRYTHPVKYLREEIDVLKAEMAKIKEEVERLDREKAGKKGRKPKMDGNVSMEGNNHK